MIEWNHNHNINCFRISSDIFPHFTDDQTESYTIDFAKPLLKQAGDLANRYGQRILMHPSQFNQVGAKDRCVYDKTVSDLQHHANILDAMGIDHNGVIIVHGGSTYGDKSTTMLRWIQQFHQLPETVKSRLVIENCERNYNTRECLEIATACGIPMVFDFFHYQCWKSPQEPIMGLVPYIIASWHDRRIVMHLSEQANGAKIGAHSDLVEQIPSEVFEIVNKFQVNLDLEIEAKLKEQAIFRLYDKYHLNSLPTLTVTLIQSPSILPEKKKIVIKLKPIDALKLK
jgi:UV DNA damage endonuclease